MTKTLVTKHEPYSIELLNYEIAQSFNNKTLPGNQFAGRRVRQDAAKVKAMRKRDRRLRKRGMSILFFAS